MRNCAVAVIMLLLVSVEAVAQNQQTQTISLEAVGRVVRLLEDSGYR